MLNSKSFYGPKYITGLNWRRSVNTSESSVHDDDVQSPVSTPINYWISCVHMDPDGPDWIKQLQLRL